MIAAAAPASSCPMIAQVTVRDRIMARDEAANPPSTQRKMRAQPIRWPSFAPVITSAATARPYTTTVELATVGGTPKSSTIPPREIGSAATLKDISTFSRQRTILGLQDAPVPA